MNIEFVYVTVFEDKIETTTKRLPKFSRSNRLKPLTLAGKIINVAYEQTRSHARIMRTRLILDYPTVAGGFTNKFIKTLSNTLEQYVSITIIATKSGTIPMLQFNKSDCEFAVVFAILLF